MVRATLRDTNTKVLVAIAQRICRDIVASTDRLEETLSAALLMCGSDKSVLRRSERIEFLRQR